MAVRGVPQLKQLLIRYSDLDGSSKGIREWMKNNLIEFAKLNPHITIRTELKRCRHPFLRGSYLNGNEKTIGIKNLEIPAIESYVKHLRMQIGRKVTNQINFAYIFMACERYLFS
jgi:large subunit ribosomal protein L43